MYRAKDAGRDRYEVFDDDLHQSAVRRLAIESDLRQALKRHQFELYYQPEVMLPSGRPHGAEALIRWRHPRRGMVQPLDFIPVAEDTGLIKPIGDWVVEQAVAQLAAWDAEVDGPRLDVLAVNLSARQLDDVRTADTVETVLDLYGIAPNRLNLEVTESAVMTDSASTKRALAAFRDFGIQVSIDDFGTGYSSLAYLHTLPVTTLKVDRSFVERLEAVDDSGPVVRAIVDMAHALGLARGRRGSGQRGPGSARLRPWLRLGPRLLLVPTVAGKRLRAVVAPVGDLTLSHRGPWRPRAGHHPPEARGHTGRALPVRHLRHDEELLAAPSPYAVTATRTALQCGCNETEDPVTYVVPVALVERLETVYVGEQYAIAVPVAEVVVMALAQDAPQHPPVGHPSKFIGEGLALDLAKVLDQPPAGGVVMEDLEAPGDLAAPPRRPRCVPPREPGGRCGGGRVDDVDRFAHRLQQGPSGELGCRARQGWHRPILA